MMMLRRLVLPAPAFKFRIATLTCCKCEAVASANDHNRSEYGGVEGRGMKLK